MKQLHIFALLLIIIFTYGCTTKINVKRVESGHEQGIRYYLPKSFIVITPQENGSMKVTVENIADRNQEYAVSAKSYMASHKLKLKLNNGLLTEISMTTDSTAVAAAAIEAAGEVKKTRIETETAALQKAEEKKEAEAKEQKETRKALEASLAAARLELAQAQAVERTAEAGSDEEKAAKIEVAKARAKVIFFSAAIDNSRLTGGGALSTVGTSGTKATDKADTGFKNTERPGPVIVMVQEDPNSQDLLQLVPINFEVPEYDNRIKIFEGSQSQLNFPSYKIPEVPKDDGGGGAGTVTIEFKFVTRADDGKETEQKQITLEDGIKTLKIHTDTDFIGCPDPPCFEIGSIDRPQGAGGVVGTKKFPVVEQVDSKTFILKFKQGLSDKLAPMVYTFNFIGVTADKKELKGSLQVEVK